MTQASLPKPAKSLAYFKNAGAARAYLRIMKKLRVPESGPVGDCRIGYAFPEQLGWFQDPSLDTSPWKGGWIVPHLFGPDKTMWMSWHPMEVLTVYRDSMNFKGGRRILVAGLGLGVFQQLVEARYDEVWTLDLNLQMAPPLWRQLKQDNWRLVIGDAYRLHTMFQQGAFDAIYLDIWKNFPGEGYQLAHELFRLIGKRLGAKVTRCWAEDLVGLRISSPSPLESACLAIEDM